MRVVSCATSPEHAMHSYEYTLTLRIRVPPLTLILTRLVLATQRGQTGANLWRIIHRNVRVWPLQSFNEIFYFLWPITQQERPAKIQKLYLHLLRI